MKKYLGNLRLGPLFWNLNPQSYNLSMLIIAHQCQIKHA